MLDSISWDGEGGEHAGSSRCEDEGLGPGWQKGRSTYFKEGQYAPQTYLDSLGDLRLFGIAAGDPLSEVFSVSEGGGGVIGLATTSVTVNAIGMQRLLFWVLRLSFDACSIHLSLFEEFVGPAKNWTREAVVIFLQSQNPRMRLMRSLFTNPRAIGSHAVRLSPTEDSAVN